MPGKRWAILGGLILILLLVLVYPFGDVAFFSIFVYYSVRPLNSKLRTWIKSETSAAILSLILLLLPLTLFFLYAGGVLSSELLSFAQTADIPYLSDIGKQLTEHSAKLSDLNPQEIWDFVAGTPSIAKAGDLFLGLLSATLDIIFKLIVLFIMTYVLIRNGPQLLKWVEKEVVHKDKKLSKELFKAIDKDLENVFYGNILTALIVSANAVILYTILNLFADSVFIPYPVLVGFFCGIVSLIPGVGVALAWIPLTIFLSIQAYVSSDIASEAVFIIIFAVSSFVFVDFIPSWVIRPKISGKGLNENLMLLSYLLGPVVFGFVGILIGPMILVFATNYMKVVVPKVKMI